MATLCGLAAALAVGGSVYSSNTMMDRTRCSAMDPKLEGSFSPTLYRRHTTERTLASKNSSVESPIQEEVVEGEVVKENIPIAASPDVAQNDEEAQRAKEERLEKIVQVRIG